MKAKSATQPVSVRELSQTERADLVGNEDHELTSTCECCGIAVPEYLEENEYGRRACRKCRKKDTGQWPHVDEMQSLFGASVWVYQNGRVKVVPHSGATATHVAPRCGERRWPLDV